MKNSKKIVALLLAALTVAPMASCGGNDNGGNSTKDPEGKATDLAVYCVDMGYGKEWCEQSLEAFKQQDWVKEKYPNLTTSFVSNTMEMFADDKLKAGKGGNPYDLLFGNYILGRTEETADLTQLVYNTKVPGEDVLYKDKVEDSLRSYNKQYYEQNENATSGVWYNVPWVDGAGQWIYNKELLTTLGYQMPVTTDEFLALCNTISDLDTAAYSKGFAITSSFEGDAYFKYSFYPLWAQYDGFDGYVNFFLGIDDFDSRSEKIFQKPGRLYATQFLQELFKYDNKYIDRSASEMGYMTAQLAFMKGNGVFMPCVDWYEHEMSYLKADALNKGQKIYEIDMLPMPILSKIIDKTPTINDDATLQAVVRAIDAGETSYQGVSEADFQIIKDARNIEYAETPNHTAVIPAIADSKEAAADFLRFLATDYAIELFAQTTCGAKAPFKYDLETNNPTYFATLPTMSMTRWTRGLTAKALPCSYNFSLANKGGVRPFRMEIDYLYQTFSAKNNTVTAQQLYEEAIEYWTNDKFAEALTKAGLA